MAGRRFSVSKNGVSVTAATAKTVGQVVAATNHAVDIWGVHIGGTGTSNTEGPILAQILRQTDAGTMSALTPVKKDDSCGDTLDSTAQHTATAEPSASDILWEQTFHPQTGLDIFFNERTKLVIGAGDRAGLRITAPANNSITFTLDCEE